MYGPQFGRRKHRLRIARIALDFVTGAELLEEPENPLRTGVVEVMNDDHRVIGMLRRIVGEPDRPCS